MNKLIYFDNAATTVGKPECVSRAVITALERYANPGRSGHLLSSLAAGEVYTAREIVCRLFGYDKPENVVFTQNATHALNLAIKGYATDGCHILISNLEHNSVIRPVHALANNKHTGITYDVFDATGDESEIIFDFTSKIKPQTTIVVVTLASNVCGRILPISKLASLCHKKGIILICDASQGAGCVPINVKALGIDVLCFAGHKGLYGPQGTGGILFCCNKYPSTIIEGGNGTNSRDKEMSGELPEKLEAGTLNTPGICGLSAGINYITKIGINEVYQRGNYLIQNLREKLLNIPDITLYGMYKHQTPTLIFNKKGIMSEELTEILNKNAICVRGGLHCAPLAHTALKTGDNGAVRASLSFKNTISEIEKFCKVVSRI